MARSGMTLTEQGGQGAIPVGRGTWPRSLQRFRPAAGGAAALIGVILMTWLLRVWASRLHLLTLPMAYLVLILAVATTFGRGPAIVAAVLSFIAVDWAFVHPIGRLTVSDPDQWLMLVTLLATGLVTGQLAGALRQRAQESREREQDTHLLYELTSAMSSHVELGPILELTARRVQETFAAVSCDLRLGELDGSPRTAQDGSAVSRPPPAGALTFPLRAGERDLGVMVVGPPRDGRAYREKERRLLTAIAAHAALAVERTRLAREASATQLVRESDALKSALLSSISHDLRTPLAAIKAFATGLVEAGTGWDAATLQQVHTAIDEEVDRLNRLVGNLLDISRLQAGPIRLHRDTYPIAEIIDESIHRLRRTLARHPVSRDVPADLPPVSLDFALIQQVLINLLENGIRHTPPGTPIHVSAQRVGGEIRVSVVDEGPGIAPSQRRAVFQTFYRLEESEGRRAGTGLGLAICRGFVEAHGGRIWVEETAGRGATITFSLPLEVSEGNGGETIDPRSR